VDIGPVMAVMSDYRSIYPEILNAVLSDEHIDCLLNVIWADPTGILTEDYVKIFRESAGGYRKPIATWIYGPRLPIKNEVTRRLEDLGFPVFQDLEMAIKALGIAYQYTIRKKGEA
jgi:acyl-CoA synthetase (NDP forming)